MARPAFIRQSNWRCGSFTSLIRATPDCRLSTKAGWRRASLIRKMNRPGESQRNAEKFRWHEFSPPDKRRPVLILTRLDHPVPEGADHRSGHSTIRGIPSELTWESRKACRRNARVNFDHLQQSLKQSSRRRSLHCHAESCARLAGHLFCLGLRRYPALITVDLKSHQAAVFCQIGWASVYREG
jgi:hypothetical protein